MSACGARGASSVRSDGGSAQRYCSAACRRHFDEAARAWVRQAVEGWVLGPARSTEGLPSSARTRYSAKSVVGLPEGPMNSSRLLGHRSASPRIRSPLARYTGRNVAPSVLRWTENHSPGAVAVPSGCSIGAVAVHEIGPRPYLSTCRGPFRHKFVGAVVVVRLYNHSL